MVNHLVQLYYESLNNKIYIILLFKRGSFEIYNYLIFFNAKDILHHLDCYAACIINYFMQWIIIVVIGNLL